MLLYIDLGTTNLQYVYSVFYMYFSTINIFSCLDWGFFFLLNKALPCKGCFLIITVRLHIRRTWAMIKGSCQIQPTSADSGTFMAEWLLSEYTRQIKHKFTKQ